MKNKKTITNSKVAEAIFLLAENLIEDVKVTGKSQKTDIIKKQIEEIISSIDDTRTTEELHNLLSQIDIKEFHYKKPKFSGVAGLAHPYTNSIYINSESITEEIPIGIIIHETIHKLQRANIFFQGKEVRGFVEGATESYTIRATKTNDVSTMLMEDPKVRVNNLGESPYSSNVIIFNQMETILGKDYMKRYALQGDTKALEEFQKQYGKKLYEKLRKFTNKTALDKYTYIGEELEDLKMLQDELLINCYDKKISQISNEAEARQFLEELRKLEEDRIHIEGDTTFIDYYQSKYKALSEKYGSKAVKGMEYTDFEFKPLYNEKQKEYFRNLPLESLIQPEYSPKYEELKRYRCQIGDASFDLITEKGEPRGYVYLSDNEVQVNGGLTKRNGKYVDFKGTCVEVTPEGNFIVSNNERYNAIGGILWDNVTLQEVPLGYSQKKWNMEVQKCIEDSERIENLGIRGLINRIRNLFVKDEPKLLETPTEERKNEFKERIQYNIETQNTVKEISQPEQNQKVLEENGKGEL